ncbi:ATP synthase subunit-like protein [Dorcoceras hygrometricum]|uniref:ATP synthase subunit-like protein n=1 Tax=Dorcoceras hygrometricum TaxID=472368 RepID=A0A2Z7BWP4_9LAMI|nr:ATP synthase subunit-like protein [Dorcoceras hygrometricum]
MSTLVNGTVAGDRWIERSGFFVSSASNSCVKRSADVNRFHVDPESALEEEREVSMSSCFEICAPPASLNFWDLQVAMVDRVVVQLVDPRSLESQSTFIIGRTNNEGRETINTKNHKQTTTFIGCLRGLPCWHLCLTPTGITRIRLFSVDCGRSGPRPDPRFLRQAALEALARSARTNTPRKTRPEQFPAKIVGGGGDVS